MLAFALSALTTVFLVVDPLAVVPLFIAMTATDSEQHRRRTSLRAAIVTFCTLAVFALTGTMIFSLLGISLSAFRVAGGILLFLLAVDMLRATPSRQRSTPEEQAEGIEKPDVSVFPLGIPMLAGPGAITTTMMLTSRASGWLEVGLVVVAVAITALATFAILRAAPAIERRLGRTGLNVMQRVMGLILAATAMQFVLDGVRESLMNTP